MTSREKRFWKGAGMVSTDILGTMIVFARTVTALVFWIRPSMRRHKKVDLDIFNAVKKYTSENNTRIMAAVTLLGKHQFLIPANLSLIYYFLFIKKQTWFSIRIVAIALSSPGLMFLLKYLFKRKRPQPPLVDFAKGLSFPSGHAIMSVTLYGLLIYIFYHTLENRTLKWSLIISLLLLIQLIGFSRVYLRVHYASDVAAGYIIGLSWLLISLNVLQHIEEYNKQHNIVILPASQSLSAHRAK